VPLRSMKGVSLINGQASERDSLSERFEPPAQPAGCMMFASPPATSYAPTRASTTRSDFMQDPFVLPHISMAQSSPQIVTILHARSSITSDLRDGETISRASMSLTASSTIHTPLSPYSARRSAKVSACLFTDHGLIKNPDACAVILLCT
jgi:hypothetical protein